MCFLSFVGTRKVPEETNYSGKGTWEEYDWTQCPVSLRKQHMNSLTVYNSCVNRGFQSEFVKFLHGTSNGCLFSYHNDILCREQIILQFSDAHICHMIGA